MATKKAATKKPAAKPTAKRVPFWQAPRKPFKGLDTTTGVLTGGYQDANQSGTLVIVYNASDTANPIGLNDPRMMTVTLATQRVLGVARLFVTLQE